jgi:uncharacterized protein (DUF58 family)
VTASPTPKLRSHLLLAGVLFVVAIALGRPELLVLAAPFALELALAIAFLREPSVAISIACERDRALEGEELAIELRVEAAEDVPRLELVPSIPAGVRLVGEAPRSFTLAAHEVRLFKLELELARWGAYQIDPLLVTASDRFGCFAYRWSVAADVRLKVYPRAERLRELVAPRQTQPVAGNRVARAKGSGIEFADIRTYVPGDPPRQINWRASARARRLLVNQRHVERSSDVLLFLDSFSDVGTDGEGTLAAAVRAGTALAKHYLAERDRVGLVEFGGTVRWLEPSLGSRQAYRIVDALLEARQTLSYAWKDIDVLPARSLPAQALVVALTPLLDERSIRALLDLRGRGFDLALVELDPEPFLPEPRTLSEQVGRRLWLLERDVRRLEFERLGVPVGRWDGRESLQLPLGEVRTFRRFAASPLAS